MNNLIKSLCTVLLSISVVFAPQALADDENILKDPSFERQLSPDVGGWFPFGTTQFSTDQARSGRFSILHSASFGVPGAFQEFPAKPGSQWRLKGYGLISDPLFSDPLNGRPAFGIVQVTFFDAAGNNLGTVETGPGQAKISNLVDSESVPGEWIFLDTGIATAPANTATIQAFTLYVDFTGIVQSVYFDDLNLCALENDDDDDDEAECKEFDDDDDDDEDDDDEDDDEDEDDDD